MNTNKITYIVKLKANFITIILCIDCQTHRIPMHDNETTHGVTVSEWVSLNLPFTKCWDLFYVKIQRIKNINVKKMGSSRQKQLHSSHVYIRLKSMDHWFPTFSYLWHVAPSEGNSEISSGKCEFKYR